MKDKPQSLPAPYWAGLLLVYLGLDLGLGQPFLVGSDWAPVWSAARVAWSDPARLYDFSYLTSLQTSLLGPLPERPFIHPPSALLFSSPFAWLPFWISLALFSVVSALVFAWAAKRAGAEPLLVLAAPPLVLAAVAGQPMVLAAAFATAGCALLGKDERAAGALLGLAAAIKPPLLLLTPIALVAAGHWRALGASAIAGCAAGVLSILLFGVQAWLDWLAALPRFQELFAASEPLLANALTPSAAFLRLGLPSLWVPAVAAAVAVPVAVLTFMRTEDVTMRLAAMIGGALLITPYAMNYELAALAPAVLATRIRTLRDMILPLVWAGSLFLGAGLLGLLAVYGWLIARLAALSAADDGIMQRRVDIPA